MVRKIILLLVLACIQHLTVGQELITHVKVNNNEVYIGQPIELTVSVHTSTWFTSGINLGNINVDGALSVFFRSVSNSKRINGKQYAGVSFYYNVFPTREGEITIPSLLIQVESPAEGGYKGIKQQVKTKEKKVNVRGIPLGYSANNWLVATGLNVRQNWNARPTQIKVGDVLQRSITCSVESTLSEFLPETHLDSINGVSIYPRRAIVNNHKTKTTISATRTETYNYLFEKEGEVIIPSIQYIYWNSANKRFYNRVLDSMVIMVQANPDLHMLESLKQSLQKESEEELAEEEGPFQIFGLSPQQLGIYSLVAILLLLFIILLFKYLSIAFKQVILRYKESEINAFRSLKKAVEEKQYYTFLVALKNWTNKMGIDIDSVDELVLNYGSSAATSLFEAINKSRFKDNETGMLPDTNQINAELNMIRKKIKQKQKAAKATQVKNTEWLNPVSKP
ncbi:BatD family protein [Labilibacter marinus]|uniref:BatD family protein n=1 Tax=Labilibacter marinus TaxID=1477105 RepID=UPI00095023A4|nr:BatD family protein [Labilibacter marinus]